MANRTILTIEIRSYWHPGTGQGLGSHLDAVTHRGTDKLPALPGRTVKGLLRDAVNRWELFGGYAKEPFAGNNPTITERLFGPPPEWGPAENEPSDERVDHRRSGLLHCPDASLAENDRNYLIANPSLISGLYRSHFSTAIEHESGTAREKSLRGIEVIVPLTLHVELELLDDSQHPVLSAKWIDILRPALHLIRAVGAHRSRGLGRAVLKLPEANR